MRQGCHKRVYRLLIILSISNLHSYIFMIIEWYKEEDTRVYTVNVYRAGYWIHVAILGCDNKQTWVLQLLMTVATLYECDTPYKSHSCFLFKVPFSWQNVIKIDGRVINFLGQITLWSFIRGLFMLLILMQDVLYPGLRAFATNRLLILPTARIQCNGVCRLALVNNLQIWCRPKFDGLVWPLGGSKDCSINHYKHRMN